MGLAFVESGVDFGGFVLAESFDGGDGFEDLGAGFRRGSASSTRFSIGCGSGRRFEGALERDFVAWAKTLVIDVVVLVVIVFVFL